MFNNAYCCYWLWVVMLMIMGDVVNGNRCVVNGDGCVGNGDGCVVNGDGRAVNGDGK